MTTRLAVLLASTVLLTACGSTGTGSGAGSTGVVGASGTGDATGAAASGAAAGFPVVIERRGGIAGFRDRVSVAADGTATVETKRGAQPDCRLAADTVQRLGRALQSLATGPAATTQAGVADAMVVTVQAPGTRVLVVPDDAQEPVTVVSEVLTRATSATCG